MRQPKQPPGADLAPRILELFEVRKRHLLVGEISLEFGYRLETCEWVLEELACEGKVRRVTPEELTSLGLHPTCLAYLPTKWV